MKKIIAVLAALVAAPVASANTDFNWDGESRTRYEMQENQGFADASGQETLIHRLKLNLTARKGETWTGHISLINNFDFGSNSGDGNTDGNIQDAGISQNQVLVNQVYFDWKANDNWMIRGGRRMIEWADGSVLGGNDYENTPTSWDGVSAVWDHDMFAADFTWNKRFEETTNAPGVRATDPEGKLWGAGVNFKGLGDWAKTAHLHVLSDSNDEHAGNTATAGAAHDLIRYGVTVGGGSMGVDYNLTYAGYSGDGFGSGAKVDMTGSMIDAKVGYSMNSWGAHFGYHTDSGTAAASTKLETYTDLASDSHGRAGKMDILAWGNLTSMNLGGKYVFNNGACSVSLDYWIFTQTEKDGASNLGTTAVAATGSATTNNSATEDALGSEIDVEFNHKFDNGLELLARVGMFSPGDEFAAPTDQTWMQYFLQGRMPF